MSNDYIQVCSLDGKGFSNVTYVEMEGRLSLLPDGRLAMFDRIGNPMPLADALKRIARASQRVKIYVENQDVAPHKANTNTYLYGKP